MPATHCMTSRSPSRVSSRKFAPAARPSGDVGSNGNSSARSPRGRRDARRGSQQCREPLQVRRIRIGHDVEVLRRPNDAVSVDGEPTDDDVPHAAPCKARSSGSGLRTSVTPFVAPERFGEPASELRVRDCVFEVARDASRSVAADARALRPLLAFDLLRSPRALSALLSHRSIVRHAAARNRRPHAAETQAYSEDGIRCKQRSRTSRFRRNGHASRAPIV